MLGGVDEENWKLKTETLKRKEKAGWGAWQGKLASFRFVLAVVVSS